MILFSPWDITRNATSRVWTCWICIGLEKGSRIRCLTTTWKSKPKNIVRKRVIHGKSLIWCKGVNFLLEAISVWLGNRNISIPVDTSVPFRVYHYFLIYIYIYINEYIYVHKFKYLIKTHKNCYGSLQIKFNPIGLSPILAQKHNS